MPTRFIGSFPEYLSHIQKLIHDAEHEVLIMADCVDNGAFANPILHGKVLEELQKALDKEVTITFLIWGKGEVATLSRANRWRYATYEQKKGDREFLDCLKNWRESQGIPEEYLNLDLDAATFERRLTALLLAAHDKVARSVKSFGGRNVEILRTESEPNLFLWLNDKEKEDALFLIPGAGASTHAAAFLTHDHQLVSMFHQTFRAHCKSPDTHNYEPQAGAIRDLIQMIRDRRL